MTQTERGGAQMSRDDLLQRIVARLDRGGSPDRRFPDRKGEYWALCPFHHDTHPDNFSVSAAGYKCFACGASGGLAALAQKLCPELLICCTASGGDNARCLPPTLENYAQVKDLPVDFLRSLGVMTTYIQRQPAVKMPYFDRAGAEIGARLRTALGGKNRFRWRYGTRVQPYGLWRLDPAAGYVILCEGESDAQTFWLHDIAALGIPGAATWKPEWARHLAGLTVYVWREPDEGGEAFVNAVAATLPDCRILAPPQGRKDISDCHLAGDDVPALVEQLKAAARPWRELQAEQRSAQARRLRERAAALLDSEDILAPFAALCRDLGLVGEECAAKLLYLAITSRLLPRPISVAVKGPSSAGKSFAVETVLRAFPSSAYYALSSMSERALAYSEESLEHRMLVLYEAAGLTSEFGMYLLRTLLSEGCIRYETVEKTAHGLKPKVVERSGPTGLIVTTTGTSLHAENETRMLSLTVRDDPAQTAAVLAAVAGRLAGEDASAPDLEPWHALQTWLELAGCREVAIPYARRIAELADARAVRLRRDFGAVLHLIAAHAVLHQARRGRDARGRIVATVADYAAVYALVMESISQGVQATVSETIRATVAAVRELDRASGAGVKVAEVAEALGVDKSAASRRLRVAIEEGYLTNLEERRGRPARLALGDPLPQERPVLPPPQALDRSEGGHLA